MTNGEHRREAESILAILNSQNDHTADVWALMALTHAVLSLARYDTHTEIRP